jgi:hypothetical protein
VGWLFVWGKAHNKVCLPQDVPFNAIIWMKHTVSGQTSPQQPPIAAV